MRVRLLGGLTVDGIAERDLGSRKGRTLLKVLALGRGRAVPFDRIVDALWPADPPARPADQVGVLVSRLRGVLGAERLPRTDVGYALLSDWLDVDEVGALGDVAGAALAAGRVGAARAAADAALALVRGPLLPEEDGQWVVAERSAADAAIARVRGIAVDAALAAADHRSAAALAEQALAHDPYDENALRSLMRAHLALRRPSSALAAYARVRERLAEDLGVHTTAATEAVHAEALAATDADAEDLHPGASVTAAPANELAGFAGRDDELAELDRALADAGAGGTPVVVVEGEAGLGKTMLVDHWLTRTGAQGVVVLRGRCDELGRDLPLQPVTDALADHLRMVGADQARSILGADGGALAPLLGTAAGSPATVVTDASTGQARMFAALAGAVARSGHGGPTVLVVEDLHLAGPSTVSWIGFARHRCAGVLLIVTARPPVAPAMAAGARTLRLGPLTVDDVARLVGHDRASVLHTRSGGHPLLLAALTAAVDNERLPVTVRDAVATQVDALGADAATTIRVAAVLGEDCDLDLVAQTRRLPAVDVLEHLEAAARLGLVVERGAGFAFRHELVREALDAAAGVARRSLVHREAARVLAGRPHPDVLAVAVHAHEGGDAELASASYVAAAEAAAARFDVEAAEQHLATALELDATAAAYTARARVRMSRLALDEADDDARRAVGLGGGARALEAAGWVAYYQRRYDEALACADEAVDRADDAVVRVSALALAGRVRHGAGDLHGAVERLTAREPAPPAVRGVADVWLAQARLHQGRPLDALDALARPMLDPDALAHPWAPLHLRFNRVLALGQLGHVHDALAATDDLDTAVGRAGAVGARFEGPAANVRAWVLRWSGRGAEADERNEAALESTGGASGPAAEPFAEAHYVALLDLADGCMLRLDTAGAVALADRLAVVDEWGGTMAWHQRHRLGLLRARLAIEAGDREAAAALATAVARDAAERGASRYELLATVLAGLADPAVPAAHLDTAVEGLARCAVLDGWPLVAALAADRSIDRWRHVADESLTRVVTRSGDDADATRAFAHHVHTMITRRSAR